MLAIVLEESNLNPNATNYNCRYKIATKSDLNRAFDSLMGAWIDLDTITTNKKYTKGYISTFCRKGHENLAWSKDGGLFQINNPEPKHYNIDENLNIARHKYNTQGKKAWVSYTTGRYKDNLAQARKLLSQI